MNAFICGSAVTLPDDIPDAGEGVCCLGAFEDGPTGCTCWKTVYDLDQAAPVEDAAGNCQPRMCDDCAYRPDSPERTGDERVTGTPALLESLVETGTPFYCHQGIRRGVKLRHPSGVVYPLGPGAYDPPIRHHDGRARPYRADGQPALICAGWMTRILHQEAT